MLSQDLVGRELTPFIYRTEATKIRHFVKSLGLADAVFVDREAAGARGFDDVPAPPGLILFVSAQDSYGEVFGALGLSYTNDLSAELDLTFHRPVVAGDELSGRTKVVGITQKEGSRGIVQFLKLETRYYDTSDELVLTEISTVAHFASNAGDAA
jgi:acyl dehydratase